MLPFHTSTATALAALTILTSTLTSVSAQCTRDGLLSAAYSYIAAQASGSTGSLPLSSTNFTYQENNKATSIKTGVLSQALKIDYNRSTADTVACASFTTLISASGSKPYVLATQIRHPGNDTSQIAMIDTIAATTGALFFNASLTLQYEKAEDWSELPTAQQTSRDVLQKAVDAYLDMWTDANAANTIPWGPGCERVEGSALTKPCNGSLPHGGSAQKNSMRRYVIDEVYGSADALCAFNSLGNMPDSHQMRLVSGLVKYVHTVTVIE